MKFLSQCIYGSVKTVVHIYLFRDMAPIYLDSKLLVKLLKWYLLQRDTYTRFECNFLITQYTIFFFLYSNDDYVYKSTKCKSTFYNEDDLFARKIYS